MSEDPLRYCEYGCLFQRGETYCAWHGTRLQPLVGSNLVLSNFRVEACLSGAGGFGVVYRGYNVDTASLKKAIKVLRPPHCYRPETVDVFLYEAGEALKGINSHHIPLVSNVTRLPFPHIVMELVEGKTLGAIIQDWRERSGSDTWRVPRKEAWGYLRGIASALRDAHSPEEGVEPVVHRDLKPINILVTGEQKREPEDRVRVIDWGIAQKAGARQAILDWVKNQGTPEYVPPEVFAGQSDARSDVYQFGVLAFELLTAGSSPYPRPTGISRAEMAEWMSHWRNVHESAPANLDLLRRGQWKTHHQLVEVVRRCLAKDPASRYQDGQELLDALEWPVPAWKKLVTATVVVLFVALLGVTVWLGIRPRDITHHKFIGVADAADAPGLEKSETSPTRLTIHARSLDDLSRHAGLELRLPDSSKKISHESLVFLTDEAADEALARQLAVMEREIVTSDQSGLALDVGRLAALLSSRGPGDVSTPLRLAWKARTSRGERLGYELSILLDSEAPRILTARARLELMDRESPKAIYAPEAPARRIHVPRPVRASLDIPVSEDHFPDGRASLGNLEVLLRPAGGRPEKLPADESRVNSGLFRVEILSEIDVPPGDASELSFRFTVADRAGNVSDPARLVFLLDGGSDLAARGDTVLKQPEGRGEIRLKASEDRLLDPSGGFIDLSIVADRGGAPSPAVKGLSWEAHRQADDQWSLVFGFPQEPGEAVSGILSRPAFFLRLRLQERDLLGEPPEPVVLYFRITPDQALDPEKDFLAEVEFDDGDRRACVWLPDEEWTPGSEAFTLHRLCAGDDVRPRRVWIRLRDEGPGAPGFRGGFAGPGWSFLDPSDGSQLRPTNLANQDGGTGDTLLVDVGDHVGADGSLRLSLRVETNWARLSARPTSCTIPVRVSSNEKVLGEDTVFDPNSFLPRGERKFDRVTPYSVVGRVEEGPLSLRWLPAFDTIRLTADSNVWDRRDERDFSSTPGTRTVEYELRGTDLVGEGIYSFEFLVTDVFGNEGRVRRIWHNTRDRPSIRLRPRVPEERARVDSSDGAWVIESRGANVDCRVEITVEGTAGLSSLDLTVSDRQSTIHALAYEFSDRGHDDLRGLTSLLEPAGWTLKNEPPFEAFEGDSPSFLWSFQLVSPPLALEDSRRYSVTASSRLSGPDGERREVCDVTYKAAWYPPAVRFRGIDWVHARYEDELGKVCDYYVSPRELSRAYFYGELLGAKEPPETRAVCSGPECPLLDVAPGLVWQVACDNGFYLPTSRQWIDLLRRHQSARQLYDEKTEPIELTAGIVHAENPEFVVEGSDGLARVAPVPVHRGSRLEFTPSEGEGSIATAIYNLLGNASEAVVDESALDGASLACDQPDVPSFLAAGGSYAGNLEDCRRMPRRRGARADLGFRLVVYPGVRGPGDLEVTPNREFLEALNETRRALTTQGRND